MNDMGLELAPSSYGYIWRWQGLRYSASPTDIMLKIACTLYVQSVSFSFFISETLKHKQWYIILIGFEGKTFEKIQDLAKKITQKLLNFPMWQAS